MSESAEALAANLKSRRNVTIEITNITNNFCLIDPMVYMENGHCHSPPQPIVRPLKTEVCNFTKGSGKTTGAVGVLTYDLLERNCDSAKERLAIMYSVPYDFNMYKNWVAIGMYSTSTECDEKLYKEMYYDKDQKNFVRAEADGCCLIHEGRNVDVLVTMSPLGRAIMKVELWDKVFCPPMTQGPY